MLSIIIPALNEADNITNLLQHLVDSSTATNITDISVIDGGKKLFLIFLLMAIRFNLYHLKKGELNK